jgi:hypothetical protein
LLLLLDCRHKHAADRTGDVRTAADALQMAVWSMHRHKCSVVARHNTNIMNNMYRAAYATAAPLPWSTCPLVRGSSLPLLPQLSCQAASIQPRQSCQDPGWRMPTNNARQRMQAILVQRPNMENHQSHSSPYFGALALWCVTPALLCCCSGDARGFNSAAIRPSPLTKHNKECTPSLCKRASVM